MPIDNVIMYTYSHKGYKQQVLFDSNNFGVDVDSDTGVITISLSKASKLYDTKTVSGTTYEVSLELDNNIPTMELKSSDTSSSSETIIKDNFVSLAKNSNTINGSIEMSVDRWEDYSRPYIRLDDTTTAEEKRLTIGSDRVLITRREHNEYKQYLGLSVLNTSSGGQLYLLNGVGQHVQLNSNGLSLYNSNDNISNVYISTVEGFNYENREELGYGTGAKIGKDGVTGFLNTELLDVSARTTEFDIISSDSSRSLLKQAKIGLLAVIVNKSSSAKTGNYWGVDWVTHSFTVPANSCAMFIVVGYEDNGGVYRYQMMQVSNV